MSEVVFEVEEARSSLLDDPVAEMTRLVLAALLDAVRLHDRTGPIIPESFSFIGFDDQTKHPIYPSGGESSG